MDLIWTVYYEMQAINLTSGLLPVRSENICQWFQNYRLYIIQNLKLKFKSNVIMTPEFLWYIFSFEEIKKSSSKGSLNFWLLWNLLNEIPIEIQWDHNSNSKYNWDRLKEKTPIILLAVKENTILTGFGPVQTCASLCIPGCVFY